MCKNQFICTYTYFKITFIYFCSFHREKPHDEEWLALREQKIPLLLNFSQCKLIASEFYPVIEHCSEVLEIDPGTILRLLANTFSAVSVQKVEIIFGITLIFYFSLHHLTRLT